MSNSKDRPTNTKSDDDAAGDRADVENAIHRPDPLRRSRLSKTWVGLAVFAVILILITDFVLQNTNTVTVSFLGWTWSVPLAVALMIAVAAGILITSLAGTVRMVQVRMRVHKDRKKG